MNFKRFHESRNLFDPNSTRYHMGKGLNNRIGRISNGAMFYIKAEPNTAYTIKVHTTDSTFVRLYLSNAPIVEDVAESYNVISESETTINPEVTISNTNYTYLWIQTGGTWYTEHGGSSIMLNEGSTALPYEPYSSEVWHDIPHYIMGTSADTFTTPAVLYPNDTTATVGLKGNMYQASGVSPDNPIQPQECGDLETDGAKAGQYKIPISSANTTTPVYLGEVETTRKIRKIVFVGSEDENWSGQSAGGGAIRFRCTISNSVQADTAHVTSVCTHLPLGVEGGTWNTDDIYTISNNYLWVRLDSSFTTTASLKSWLAQQYANGTPVTIWYVLATPETGIVNEPIRKIGDYADTVSGITIPTVTGKDTFDVVTTLKPSEVSLSYTGWHDAIVHEKSRNLFDSSTLANDYTLNATTGLPYSFPKRIATLTPIDVTALTSVTLSYQSEITDTMFIYAVFNGSTLISRVASNRSRDTIDVSGGDKLYISFYSQPDNITTDKMSNIMLNTGGTALPYEPYWT